MILSLCGCTISDIIELTENNDIKAIDLDTDSVISDVVRIIDESENEVTSELVTGTNTETDVELTNAETISVVTTISESTITETTVAETKKVQETTAEETKKEVVTEKSQDSITITQVSSQVKRNETAIVSIKGKPNTEYSISVYYSTTASKASGLEKKQSDANGNVTWNWKIGGKTKFGTFKIVISGGGEKVETQFTVS